MDIKTQIQQEAEKRYTTNEDWSEREISEVVNNQYIFIEGAEWLDTEIVQPLRKENEEIVTALREVTKHRNELCDECNALQSQLSLSEGEIERLKQMIFVAYSSGGTDRAMGKYDWGQFKTDHNIK